MKKSRHVLQKEGVYLGMLLICDRRKIYYHKRVEMYASVFYVAWPCIH